MVNRVTMVTNRVVWMRNRMQMVVNDGMHTTSSMGSSDPIRTQRQDWVRKRMHTQGVGGQEGVYWICLRGSLWPGF